LPDFLILYRAAIAAKKSSALELTSLLDDYFRPEMLEGADAYLCGTCASKQTATKRLQVTAAPQHLLVCLKRHEYDWRAGTRKKLMAVKS
jgi:ubiquitin C-terminal hydrolase